MNDTDGAMEGVVSPHHQQHRGLTVVILNHDSKRELSLVATGDAGARSRPGALVEARREVVGRLLCEEIWRVVRVVE